MKNNIIKFNKRKIDIELSKKGKTSFLHDDGNRYTVQRNGLGIKVFKNLSSKEDKWKQQLH